MLEPLPEEVLDEDEELDEVAELDSVLAAPLSDFFAGTVSLVVPRESVR